MNLNKRSHYEKFKCFSDLLSEESIVYVYADDEEKAFRKIDKIFKFCNVKEINPKMVYIDIGKSKDLINKPNLARIFRDEENVDIITCNSTDISPFGTGDYYDIRRFLKESNLGVYDLNYENYYYERSPMLVWLGN